MSNVMRLTADQGLLGIRMTQHQPDRPELLQLMGHAIVTTGQTNQILWTQGSIFWAANAVLIAALFQTGEFPKDPHVGILVSLFGVFVAIVWRLLQDRLLLLLLRDEELGSRIQHTLSIPENLFVSKRPDAQGTNELGLRTAPAKKVVRVSNAFAILFWFCMLMGFAVAASVKATPNPSVKRTPDGAAYLKRCGTIYLTSPI